MNAMGHCSTQGFCINKYVFLAIPLAAIYRLAVFNIDTRQSRGFIGVPTPITGLTIASMIFLFDDTALGNAIGDQTELMIVLPFIFAFFMLSNWEMFAFKIKKGDPFKIQKGIFLLVSVAVIALFPREAGLSIYLMYIVISLLSHYFVKNHD